MFDDLNTARQSIVTFADRFDVNVLSPATAEQLVLICTQIEAPTASIKALAAARAAEGSSWKREGFRSPADELAKKTKTSPSAAKRTLDTGRRLGKQPEVAKAALSGQLSPEQAAVVAEGVEADPAAAGQLLSQADTSTLAELSDEVARVKAAATDREARRRGIHQRRYFRRWSDRDGALQAHLYGHVEDGANMWNVLDPIRRRLAALREHVGRRESFEALDYDALVAIAEIAAGRDGELSLSDLLDLGLFPQLDHEMLADREPGRTHPDDAPRQFADESPGTTPEDGGPDPLADRLARPSEEDHGPGRSSHRHPGPGHEDGRPGPLADRDVGPSAGAVACHPGRFGSEAVHGSAQPDDSIAPPSCEAGTAAAPGPGPAVTGPEPNLAPVDPAPRAESSSSPGEASPPAAHDSPGRADQAPAVVEAPPGTADASLLAAGAPSGTTDASLVAAGAPPGTADASLLAAGAPPGAADGSARTDGPLAADPSSPANPAPRSRRRPSPDPDTAARRKRRRKFVGSPTRIMVRVDLDTLLRGVPIEGELCEIAGYGPVAVSVIEKLAANGNAIVVGVLTKSTQVLGVYHHRRRPNAYQASALQFLYPCCAVAGCGVRVGLQADHREDWIRTKFTVFDLLDRLCPHHHRLKTEHGWGLVTGSGKRAFVPPDDPCHPERAQRAARSPDPP